MDFPSTDWSQLALATLHGDSAAHRALERFYLEYRPPVRVIMLKRGVPESRVDDVCQDFFVRLMEKSFLRRADPARGRFRAFLSTVLRCFLADEAEHRMAKKRGGHAAIVSLDATDGLASRLVDEAEAEPDLLLDHEWALHLVQRALERVAREWTRGRAEKQQRFEVMRSFLPGSPQQMDNAEATRLLGMSDIAFRCELSRLRAAFRAAIHAEVSLTVSVSSDVADEMRHLLAVLQASDGNSLKQRPRDS